MSTKIPRKQTIFLVRLIVIITTAYFILLSPSSSPDWKTYGYLFIAFYLSSNLVVVFIPDRYFHDDKIFYGFILFDSILLPAGIYFSGYVGSDLYLMFFFIISLTTISSHFGYLLLNTVLFSLIYCWLLYEKGMLTGPEAGGYLIQIPFIIVIAGFYGFLITTRLKDKDNRISEARERYAQIVQATDVLMCIVDHEGQFLFANQKIVDLYGPWSGQSIARESRALDYVDAVFKQDETLHYESFDKKHSLWFANTLSPVRDPKTKEVIAVSIISKDISERIEKEKKLSETVDLLKRTRDQLIQKDKMAALGRLASGIAHEIRNPLEIIYMGMDYLENHVPNNDPAIKESMEKIFSAVDRADSIIRNVLSFSRQSVCKIEMISLYTLLDDVLKLAEPTIQKHGVQVSREFDNKTIEVAGDKSMLQQVFLNLINNAVDAMKERKEKILTIRSYKQFVTEVGYKTGNRKEDFFGMEDEMIVVEISDTGTGIPEDVLLKIFEPFFSTKTASEGTGLGLSIAHMIMDRLRGTIDVKSVEKEGTTFYVKLQPGDKTPEIEGGVTCRTK